MYSGFSSQDYWNSLSKGDFWIRITTDEGRKQWATNVFHVLAGNFLRNTCHEPASTSSLILAFPNMKRSIVRPDSRWRQRSSPALTGNSLQTVGMRSPLGGAMVQCSDGSSWHTDQYTNRTFRGRLTAITPP